LQLGLIFDPRQQETLGYKIYGQKITKNLKIVIFKIVGGARVPFSVIAIWAQKLILEFF
jgi:hypothetical protein